MVRPVVLFQSDDWGRVGISSVNALAELKSMGYSVGQSAWDYFGLETTDDVRQLGETLSRFRAADGKAACFTANFIMANADLRRMAGAGFTEFIWIPLSDGFPPPWDDHLLPVYKRNIAAGVFYPGLHGFTHFNISGLLHALAESSKRGDRARALAALDVPYIRSITPEYCFALTDIEPNGESFVALAEQKIWIRRGVELFTQAFGFSPVTACTPGYRCNDSTLDLLHCSGVSVIQSASHEAPHDTRGLLSLGRNVFFEPVLGDKPGAVIERAIEQAEGAVVAGLPIIVCSHSINYISRFLGKGALGRDALATFLTKLMAQFRELRFASDVELLAAWRRRDPDWIRPPSSSEITARARLAMLRA